MINNSELSEFFVIVLHIALAYFSVENKLDNESLRRNC